MQSKGLAASRGTALTAPCSGRPTSTTGRSTPRPVGGTRRSPRTTSQSARRFTSSTSSRSRIASPMDPDLIVIFTELKPPPPRQRWSMERWLALIATGAAVLASVMTVLTYMRGGTSEQRPATGCHVAEGLFSPGYDRGPAREGPLCRARGPYSWGCPEERAGRWDRGRGFERMRGVWSCDATSGRWDWLVRSRPRRHRRPGRVPHRVYCALAAANAQSLK